MVIKLARRTDSTLDVIAVLLQAGDDIHGLAIAKAAGRQTGTVYPILMRLEELGWIISHWEEVDQASRGPRRRMYRLSTGGSHEALAVLKAAGRLP